MSDVNLFEKFIGNIDIENPDWDNKQKCHDWKNYVPIQWVETWEYFTTREKQIIVVMAEMQADKEEWD